MKFCSECGHATNMETPIGDNRKRDVCVNCDAIYYQNPKIITGCIPVFEERVLLCRRAIEPRLGFWTLPAGFMENDETCLEAALRECAEEANVHIDNPIFCGLFDLTHINQVYLFYRGYISNGSFSPGIESLEVKLFKEHEIPWQDLAFPIIELMLKHHFEDMKISHTGVRTGTINRSWKS